MHYVIKNTPDTPNDAEGTTTVPYNRVHAVVDELSGRPGIAGYCLSQLRGDKVRTYVATAIGSPGRVRFGKGFIVEKIG